METKDMKNKRDLLKNFCAIGRFVFLFVISLTAANGQESLRDALDFDGDNKADPVVARPANNTWYTFKSGGAGFETRTFGAAVTDIPAPGDYDGDGKGDFGVYRPADGTFYYFLSSNSTFGSRQWGIVGDEPIARRWDNDAVTDFAVVRRANNQLVWYILRSSDNATNVQIFGLPNDIPVAGDYDGDGRFDTAVRRAATANAQATFYLNRTTAGFAAIEWGLGNDFVATGDYDGDGKTDLSAVRADADNLFWYILNSSNGAAQIKNFGLSRDDYPVSNDYDGDGKTDIAVWRKTDGIFYIENSGGGYQFIKWGGQSDFPVAGYDMH